VAWFYFFEITMKKCVVLYDPEQYRTFPSPSPAPKWAGNILAGMTQATLVTITGYPFDLVKAKMQAKRKVTYTNALACVKDVVKSDGMFGLYRGSAMPWISHMIKRPAQFPVSEYLKSRYATNANHERWERIRNNYIIGAGCGIIGPIFGTPLQVIKVGMQTSSADAYKSSLAYARSELKNRGLRGMYRGFIPTAVKDCVFGGSFVGSYYTLRDTVGTDSWMKNFFNGAAAHCITWFLFIPIDYVKTNIQRAKVPTKRSGGVSTKPTILGVIKEGYRQGGIRIFWKGVIPACVRTIPVSGVAMTGYEWVRKSLGLR
jgi:hypothetical protein